MRRALAILPLLLTLSACVHAQQSQKWAGQAGLGGQMGMQKSSSPTLQITVSALPNGTIGVAYSQTITTQFGTAPLTFSVDSGSLPGGLSLNTSTGAITGTPTNNAGIFSFVIKVVDSSGSPQTAKQPFSISILCTPLQIISGTTLPIADQGTAFNFTVQTTGGIAPLTCAATGLPTGESINSSTCAITGTPSVTGAFNNIVITVTDSCPLAPQTATQTASQQVNSTLAITTPPMLQSGTAGVLYTTQIAVAGGTPGYTYALTGSLPSGLTLNTSTGVITGTPTTPGTFSFTITATDSIANTAAVVFSLTIACPALSITSQTLPNGTQGSSYGFQESSAGGFGTILWSGILFPNGLSISSTGAITGTPTEFGTFTPQITATDSCPTPQSVSISPTLVLAQQVGPLTITSPATLSVGTVGQQYSVQLQATGGFTPYNWTQTGGVLPTGTSLTLSGVIIGLPSASGVYAFTAQVTDRVGTAVSQAFSITINVNSGALTITSATPLTSCVQGQPCSVQVSATGGTPPYQWTVPAGTIPVGGQDILDYALMPVGTRQTSHLSATGLYKAFRLDAGLFWWVKNSQGFPSDGERYDGTKVYQWFTEMDSSQDAACQAEGWPSCFSDPQAYKRYQTPVALWSRYHVPAADDVVFTPGPNRYDLTTNCGVDAQTPIDNLGVRGELTGPFTDITWQTTYGGNVPDNTPYLLAQKWIKCTANNILNCTNEEDYWLVKGYGQVRWCAKHLSGGVYVTDQCTTQTTVSAGGAPTPNFACNIPTLNGTGNLPPGVLSTAAPQLDLAANSGLESGTPTTAGSSSFTIQVEDAIGTMAQKAFTQSVTVPIPALQIGTASPLPAAIEGQPYSVQMAASGGVSPYTWAKTAGVFPAGITMNAAGAITGTPTAAGTGTSTLQVTDTQPVSASGVFSLTVSCPAFTVTTNGLPPATQGTAYAFQMASQGGFGSVTWGGSGLPTGLSISSGGLISGTTSVSGPFTPTLTATDSCSPTPQAIPVTLPLQVNTNLAITTTTLTSGTVGTPYSQPLNATGGTPPYTWSVTGGTLQTGLTLNASTGVISGTPSVASTVTLTIRVTDSIPNNVSGTFTLTINPAVVQGGADNRYCSANETINATALPQDGPAAPLQKCVRTALADTPSNGSVVTAAVSSCSSLQASINAATCGQTISIPALNAGLQNIYNSCNLVITNKCTASAWLTIKTASTSIPAEGNRVSPAFIGVPSLHIACPAGSIGPNGECGRPTYSQPATPGIYMPKIVAGGTNNPAITFNGASHIRVIGLEATSAAGKNMSQVVRAQNANDHIILDRVIVHGQNSPNFQSKNSTQAAIRFDSTQFGAVIDSYIADTICVLNVTCTDSQAVYVGGSVASASGPVKVINNFLETAGEEVLSGGGGVGTTTLPVTDLEVRRNHFFKPMFWKSNDPSFLGTTPDIKNHFEMKNANRVLFEANILDQNWGFQGDQHGEAIHLNAFNQNVSYSGTATASGSTLTWKSGTQFKSDIIAPTCAHANQCSITFNGIKCLANTWTSGTTITVTCTTNPPPAICVGNFLDSSCYTTTPPQVASASFTAAEPGQNPSANVQNVTMRYFRISHAGNGAGIANPRSDNGDLSLGGSFFTMHDFVEDDIDGSRWDIGTGACCGWGVGLEIFNSEGGTSNLHDIQINHGTVLATISTSTKVDQGASFGQGNQSIAGSSIGNLRIYDNIGPSGWWTGGSTNCPGTGGGSSAQLNWNCWTPVAQKCWDNNFLAISTTLASGTGSFTHNNTPFPVAADNGFCPYGAPKGNTLVTNYTTFQFTNLLGANGGNYLLQLSSPYKGQASDGKDPGADINGLNTALAGVQ